MNLTQVESDSQDLGESIIGRLSRYVLKETPTGDKTALDEFSAVIAGELAEVGAKVRFEERPTGNHLVADIAGRGDAGVEPILFLTHHDTVWPVGQLETMPLAVANGILHGPGSYDMKGGIAVLLEALTLCQRDAVHHRPVRIVMVADEEIGSPSAREFIESQQGTVHCVLGLEPPHPNGDVKTSRWGSTRVRISATGRESHAALDPLGGISAIDELLDQLMEVRAIMLDYPYVLCNVGTISGGGRTNVIPGQASADVGLRFQDAAVEAEVLKRLLDRQPVRQGAVVECTILSNRPAWTASTVHDELLATLTQAATSIGQSIGGGPATGAADTNICGWLGIPTVDGLGPIGRGAHAIDEQVMVASLAQRARLLAAVIQQL